MYAWRTALGEREEDRMVGDCQTELTDAIEAAEVGRFRRRRRRLSSVSHAPAVTAVARPGRHVQFTAI